MPAITIATLDGDGVPVLFQADPGGMFAHAQSAHRRAAADPGNMAKFLALVALCRLREVGSNGKVAEASEVERCQQCSGCHSAMRGGGDGCLGMMVPPGVPCGLINIRVLLYYSIGVEAKWGMEDNPLDLWDNPLDIWDLLGASLVNEKGFWSMLSMVRRVFSSSLVEGEKT